jgi:hypothetical protein
MLIILLVACAVAVAIRVLLVTYISVTSYSNAIYANYIASAAPLLLVFAGGGSYLCWQFGRHLRERLQDRRRDEKTRIGGAFSIQPEQPPS